MKKCGWQTHAYFSHSFAFIITPAVIKVGNFRMEENPENSAILHKKKIPSIHLLGLLQRPLFLLVLQYTKYRF